MPIREDELRTLARQAMPILDDRPCRACGYNLRGLRTDQNCPECGKPIAGPKDIPRYSDQMVNAPLSWLKRFNMGCGLLFWGGVLMLISSLVMFVEPHVVPAGFFALGSALWASGAWIAVSARPMTKAMAIDPAREWRVSRILSRCTQVLWLVAGTLVIITLYTSGALHIAVLGGLGVAVVLGLVGFWPTGQILSDLSYWASDTELADHLRNASWLSGVGIVATAVFVYLSSIGVLGGAIGSILTLLAWGGGIIFPMGYGMVGLYKLWRMSHWVLLNHVTAEARDDRLRARAHRVLQQPSNHPPTSSTSR